MLYIHIYILCVYIQIISHKKEQNLAICDKRDVKGVMLSEISQREKDKHCMIFFPCGF